MPTLARQATSDTDYAAFSLVRDNQLRTQLEAGLLAAIPSGVVSGCLLTKVSGFTVSIPSGAVFFAQGVTLTLGSAQQYTAGSAGTVYVWAKILRTAGTFTDPLASDTYSLSVTHNTSGTAPSSDHFPLAILLTNAAGIQHIDNAPAGKYVPTVAQWFPQSDSIATGAGATVDSGEQLYLRNKLTVRGYVKVRGLLTIEGRR